ncbi:hypothetical protein GCM10027446_23230 [Angustibacter peucedani]
MADRYPTAARDTVVAALLADPAARVVAISETGLIVPMPAEVPVREGGLVTGASSLLELVDPDDILAVIDAWSEARERGAVSVQVRSVHDAAAITVHAVDARHAYGVFLGFLVGFRDAAVDAEAPRGADALRPRVCIVRKDELARITAVDETAARLLGWTDAELGQRSLELTHPDDQQRAIANWMDLLASPGGARRTRLRQRHADGSWMWFEITNRNLLAHPDHRCVLSEMVDIGEEMAATEALRLSDQLMRRLTESLPVGILQMGVDGHCIYRNERLAAVVGTQVDDLQDLLRVVVDPERVRDVLRTVRDSGADGEIEVEVTGAGGFRRRLHLSVRGLLSDDGTVSGGIMCVSDVTEAADLREQLAYKATHDQLTGCLQRSATLDRLEQTLAALPADDASVAVLFIDLDGFKQVNDQHGHAAGDAMLREVGRRLLADVDAQGAVGRFGGDEFVVLRADLPSAAAADRAAVELAEKLQTPFEHQGLTLVPHASVGASWTDQRDSADPLVARADASMYRRKRSRPDRRPRLLPDA